MRFTCIWFFKRSRPSTSAHRCPRCEIFATARTGILFGKPGFQGLPQCLPKTRFHRRRARDRFHAQALNAAEFIQLQVEYKRRDDLQIKFTILAHFPIEFASMGVDHFPLSLFIDASCKVDSAFLNQKTIVSGNPLLGLYGAIPPRPFGYPIPAASQ